MLFNLFFLFCSVDLVVLTGVYVTVGICLQAIAHYEQAADYYKGEESIR